MSLAPPWLPRHERQAIPGGKADPLEPDHDQLEIFIQALFRYCSPDGIVNLRSFYQNDANKAFRYKTCISLKDGLKPLIEAAVNEARLAANASTPIVFSPPVATFKVSADPRDKWRARQEDLLEGPAFSIELDENPRTALAKLEHLLGPATLVVRSGGIWTNPTTGEVEDKLHAYWRLKEPARGEEHLAKLKEARRLAHMLVGGDPSNVPINHPIRWPGSWHRKDTPRLCQIISSTDQLDNEIDLDVALAALEDVTPQSREGFDFTQKSTASSDGEAAPKFKVAPDFTDLPVEDLGEGIETYSWWDRLSGKQKDAALDHGLECIANNSKMLQLREHGGDGYDTWFGITASVARSDAPHAEDIFIKYASKATGADPADALQQKFRDCQKNPRANGFTIGTFIHWARQCGANFEPWLEAAAEGKAASEFEAKKGDPQEQPPAPEPNQQELNETNIPPDTLREIQNPRSKKLWNVLMVLKDRGFTINSSIALFTKYPTGMYAKYRGRLQNEVEKIWAKLSEGEEEKNKVPPAPVGPPIPIDKTIKIFERWLLLKDHTPVYAVLGTIAANYLEGDPVWLGVIGPPSSAKTEILNATSMLPHVVQAATLTVAGLLSGTPKRQRATGAKGGLLQQIGEFGIITLKDFGSILSMHTETRAEVLAALREIYDGDWTRHIGSDGGRTLSWKGKVGLVFAATEVIDSHYAVIGAMGDRFLLSRLAPTPGQPQFHRALAHLGGTTKQMRKELAEAVVQLFAGRRSQPQPISPQEANRIGKVISLAVRLRAAVERDRRTSEIVAIHGVEGTARIGLALERLLAGLDTLGVKREKAMEVVLSVALDSVPPLRRQAYECVAKYSKRLDPVDTTDVATDLGLPTNTARRILEELAAHGLVTRDSQGQGKADLWNHANWEAEDKKAEEELISHSPKKSEEPDRSGAVYALQGMKQPETVPCAYCRQTGNVYQFADGSLPQDHRRLFAMHPECAEAFFTGQPQPPGSP